MPYKLIIQLTCIVGEEGFSFRQIMPVSIINSRLVEAWLIKINNIKGGNSL
jgi:hypothetical protein